MKRLCNITGPAASGTIRRTVKTLFALLVCAIFAAGCFKKVSNDTQFIIKPNLQAESGAEMSIAGGARAYAWFNRTTDWVFASYEDALAGVLTDTLNRTTESVAPDAESVTLDTEGMQGLLQIDTRSQSVMLLVLYPDADLCAWRIFATGENLSPTYLTVQFRPWKTGAYTDSGWFVDGIFPEPEPEPDPEEPGTGSDDPSEDDEEEGGNGDEESGNEDDENGNGDDENGGEESGENDNQQNDNE